MQTKQAIQTSANVVRITSISAGDVYKRFDESYDDRTYFGVVKNVFNDGDKTIIESTEYCYKYGGVSIEHKVLRGEKDYILFPATPEEMNLDFESAIKSKVKENDEALNKIRLNEKMISELKELITGNTQKKLKAMSFKELTQNEYNDRLQALN